MGTVLKIAIIAVAAFAFFSAGPALTSFFTVFTRKTGTHFRDMDIENSYFAPIYGEMCDSLDRLGALEQRKVKITANDGVELCAVYYPADGKDTVILVQGYNTPAINNYVIIADWLHGLGYNVLMPDCRGHGESGGKRCSLGLLEQYDLLRWSEYAAEDAENIFIYGTSMGCATVSYASDKLDCEKVRGLVLDCGFSSPYSQMKGDMERRHIPRFLLLPFIRLLGKWILKVDIKTPVSESLSKCTIPALFLHGTADETVPLSEGHANYESCASEKDMIIVEGAAHTMSFHTGGEKVRRAVADFFGKHRKGAQNENI